MSPFASWLSQFRVHRARWFERVHQLPITGSTWLVAGCVLGFGSVPLFSRPGYESALLFGLLIPPITAVSAARAHRSDLGCQPEQRLLTCLRRAAAHALVVIAWLSLRASWLGWCSALDDLMLFTLGPVAGIFAAAAWGFVVGLVFECWPWKRGREFGRSALSLLAPLLAVVWGIRQFYGSPVVFAFSPFVGFFAGSPYDTGFHPVPRLLTYRAGLVGLLLATWAVARHLVLDGGGRVRIVGSNSWTRTEWRRGLQSIDGSIAAVGLLGLTLSITIAGLGEPLGHRSSTAWIRNTLARTTRSGRCEVVHGTAQKQVTIQRMARDCDAWLTRLERRLGAPKLERVTAFVFDSPEQKERLMGAAQTQIAKPWRKEIYLNHATYPDDVLGHELAHVVAGSIARGPFKVAGALGGWLPNPGLIEGMAVALAPDEDGELTAREWSAALVSIGRLPDVKRLFSLDFLGHSGPLAYTVAGAFVEWVAMRYGQHVAREWYRGQSLEDLSRSSWTELERDFRAELGAVALSPLARDAAAAKFQRPGVFNRRCPHAVDSALARADGLLRSGDALGACALYDQARVLDPTEMRARFGLAACSERQGSAEARLRAAQIYQRIADDAGQPVTIRLRAREKLADLYLVQRKPELARTIYQQIEGVAFDSTWRRSLKLKLEAETAVEIEAVSALLLGVEGEPAWDVAVRNLVRWSNEAPADGTADYLLGRNYWQHGREAVAVEHLDRALQRLMSISDIRAEAERLRAVMACAMADTTRAVEIATRLSASTALPTPRRLGLLRIVERCSGQLAGDDWPQNASETLNQGPTLASSASQGPTLASSAFAAAVTSSTAPLLLPGESLGYDADDFVCPSTMRKVRGGPFHMGLAAGGNPDESPPFLTQVRGFCLDGTEVTVDAYARCVSEGNCSPALGKSASCNARHADRGNHPINCVSHPQATAFCASLDQRLPSEIEWEYAARGGDSRRKYPWGDASPDGRACWKSPHSCAVASFAAGAFGLFDMSGNVWEWTASDFGAYPWSTPLAGEYPLKIYRGGGWSRRFEKWMRLGLRNRALPQDLGAHLGFRCAKEVTSLACPAERSPSGACLVSVVSVACAGGTSWNGQRCVQPSEPLCPEGHHPEPGQGCVRDVKMIIRGETIDVGAVQRVRTPEFDADCRSTQSSRPKAYRFSGSTHQSRNLAAKAKACKNRDVGAGWNSTCCP